MKFLLVSFLILLLGCTSDSSNEGLVASFSVSDVASHSSVSDCWLIIDSSVYDVTGFISRHPGGSVISQGCGINATGLFETRPTGSMTPHSSNARSMLSDYFIGVVE